MSELVPLDPNRGFKAPAKATARLQGGGSLAKNFQGGVTGGFPVLSIRAAKFHLRMDGAEITIPDPNTGYAAAFVDVVLVDAAEKMAKSYYIDAFGGDANPPDCWSLDAIRPDPMAQKKQNPTCQDCRHNVFGSKFTPEGKPAKECADQKRIALCFPRDLASPAPQTMLLRVPPSSLKNMRNYIDKLVRNGYEPDACITRMSFDSGATYPKLQFEFYGPLNDQEYDTVEHLRESAGVKAMLAGAELVNAASGANVAGTTRTGLVPTPGPVQGLTIDAIAQKGFAAGDLQPKPVQQAAAPAPAAVQPAVQQDDAEELVELETGEWLNTATGEIVSGPKDKVAEPQLDPDVTHMKDGRFFHRTKKYLVDSPYVGAERWQPPATVPKAEPAVEPEVKAEQPVKRRGRKPRQPEPEQAEAQPEAQQEPEEQGEPEQQAHQGNGTQQASKPTVVAASPKLEALLGKLVPNRDD